ncbi:4-aminobutyrate---pyruvate transaminase [Arboricoccus pini]|uniref:4-aminobutyrate---pyruvate transaminase n=1 Tax=Arboricoccus pini TaxID=1963835 RepID=A0A212Q6M4_9PROT|nr:aminotransferase [Arboricoccus pini]SNB55045.1 4-aminobutyrate---pyruvate transaminase [Arboricoccus pini]
MDGMIENSIAARDIRYLVHGSVDLARQRQNPPTMINGGKGIFIFDENGTPYLEAAAGMWCTALGFSEEELIEAATEQMRKLPYYHTLAYKSVTPAAELAEKLAALVPIENAHLYFALSGSEANDAFIKFAWYVNNALGRPEKKKIIARKNGYHGATLGSASLSGISANHKLFDLPIANILHVSDPHYYRNGLPGESEAEFVDRLVGEVEALILAEGPDTVAAFVAEPVTGAGGVVIPPAGYYTKLQAVLDRYDVIFHADEVINGFLRTGKMWGSEAMGIRPTTMSMAKAITSAYMPLSALALPSWFYDAMERGSTEVGVFGHAATYAGHPVSCAVALKMLEIVERRNLKAHVETVGARFKERILAFKDHPLVGDVRVIGLMGAIEFVTDKANKTSFVPTGSFAKRLRDHAEERQKLIVRAVPAGDSCAFSPPLVITIEEVDEMFDRFAKALDEVTAEVGA